MSEESPTTDVDAVTYSDEDGLEVPLMSPQDGLEVSLLSPQDGLEELGKGDTLDRQNKGKLSDFLF